MAGGMGRVSVTRWRRPASGKIEPMTDSELIPRDRLLEFWDSLSSGEIAELRNAAETDGVLTPELVARMSPVVGGFGARWGSSGPWSFNMFSHLRDFILSLRREVTVTTGGDIDGDETNGQSKARLEFGHSNFHYVDDVALRVGDQGQRTVTFVEGR